MASCLFVDSTEEDNTATHALEKSCRTHHDAELSSTYRRVLPVLDALTIDARKLLVSCKDENRKCRGLLQPFSSFDRLPCVATTISGYMKGDSLPFVLEADETCNGVVFGRHMCVLCQRAYTASALHISPVGVVGGYKTEYISQQSVVSPIVTFNAELLSWKCSEKRGRYVDEENLWFLPPASNPSRVQTMLDYVQSIYDKVSQTG